RDVRLVAVRGSNVQLAVPRLDPAALHARDGDRHRPDARERHDLRRSAERCEAVLPSGSTTRGDDMSQAATHAVEPAETPLTPDSWGKLGMWIFLAGDAVGFGVLLSGY